MSEQPQETKELPVVGSQTDSSGPAPADEDEDFTPRYLEPAKTHLFRSPLGSPRLELEGEICYPRVTVRQILPLHDPDRYLSLWIGDDREIGMIRNPDDMDEESRRILREELGKQYFVPIILKIHRVKERFGIHDWDVDTSRGAMKFSVSGLHQNVKHVPPSRLIVTDVRGNRYDIPDIHQLDAQSYAQIQRHL